ncbi:DUF2079 domain-containing protein [Rivularia sp. UHCC 0363]|uniref:DUF2079 domain-containing protein n=1 Tax=Rivularia sp. UHCC 0363 TaxID=3110244 RepID=UPI002B20CB35|nr:DUF2079 domain-containing protein [Rivularia sp. UHCC 0363]MEA5593942.1 DUF2079 domain-containing protein [Rivularia sp. UHCC 0363]
MGRKFNQLTVVSWLIAISTLVLFACSSLRHILFESTAFDLGIFDQAVYLISRGEPPISSFLNFHILGDHATWIWYPLALLYKIYESVYWLFFLQALALALGALPTWLLGREAGLPSNQAFAILFVYLLYPVVFNVNLFDFHPEVMALPALLAAVWFARQAKIAWFSISIIFIIGCKAVLSLTIAGMGVWLIFFEKRRLCGAIALGTGIAWFLISSQVIIPYFRGQELSYIGRYSYLGNSILEIAQNLILKPGIVLEKIFSVENLFYLILLLLPVIWGLSFAGITPLVGAIPCVALNLLADYQPQKDLVNQYSLPALPFLLLTVIATLAAGKGWLKKPRKIILWSFIVFLALAKYGYFWSIYLDTLDTWKATREAVSQVQTEGGVLTTATIAPHLAHRKLIELTNADLPLTDVTKYDYILLNLRHPGWLSNLDFVTGLISQLKDNQKFNLQYQRDDVFLFIKRF